MIRVPLTTVIASALVALLALLAGCETGLQKQLDDKKTARYQAAASALHGIEAVRTKLMEQTLPAPDKAKEGAKHPMVSWRTTGTEHRVEDLTDEDRLLALADQYKGTPSEAPARAGSAFARESASFWKGDANLERYTKFLSGYLADAAAETKAAREAGDTEAVPRPFQAEAGFDRIFVHAARYYQLAHMPPDVQLTTAFPYWQLAFRFESKPRESFSDYVTRLCRSKLRERCQGVPHEVRPAAINKPYLEWLLAQAKTYLEAHPKGVYADVVKRYQGALNEALAATPDLTEDPVLPATVSDRAASNGLRLVMSPKSGSFLHTRKLEDAFAGRLPAGLGEAAAAVIEELKATPGNMIDFERVVLEMPGEAGASLLPATFKAFPSDVVRQVDLVGRRRADESLRRTGVLVRLPPPDDSGTTSYQLKDQADRTSCAYLGIAGKPPIGRKEPGSYLVVGASGIRAAKLSRDPETRELSVGATETLDPTVLGTWADGNEGIVRMFVPAKVTYDELLQQVSGLLYRCVDTEVAVDERGLEKVKVTCGDTQERDITLVLALCGG